MRGKKSGNRMMKSKVDSLQFTWTMAFPGLAQKIKQQYKDALKAGIVHFTDSEIEELDDEQTGIPVSSLTRSCGPIQS